MTTAADIDPLAELVKVPSLSFKEKPVGTAYTGIVVSLPKWAQTTDFATGKPAFWKNEDGTQGAKKMAIVLRLRLIDDEKEYSLWAPKPSSMLTALVEAQTAFGRRIEIGGTLTVTFSGTEKAKNPKHNDQKLYTIEYIGPEEAPVDDPLGVEDFKDM